MTGLNSLYPKSKDNQIFKGNTKRRRDAKKATELQIKLINEYLNSGTLTQDEQRETKRKLEEKELALEKIEDHLAKGTSVRSRQEWDINA